MFVQYLSIQLMSYNSIAPTLDLIVVALGLGLLSLIIDQQYRNIHIHIHP